MTDTPDMFVVALAAELEAHNAAMPPGMSDDMMELCGYARSIRNRQLEIDENERWITARNTTLRNDIERIFGFQQSKILGCVNRLSRGKAKSVKVPGMQFGTRARKTSVSWEPEDKDALVKWAKEFCPAAVTVTTPDPREVVTKMPLVEFYQAHGRTPKFCTITQAHNAPYFKVLTEKKEDKKEDDDG